MWEDEVLQTLLQCACIVAPAVLTPLLFAAASLEAFLESKTRRSRVLCAFGMATIAITPAVLIAVTERWAHPPQLNQGLDAHLKYGLIRVGVLVGVAVIVMVVIAAKLGGDSLTVKSLGGGNFSVGYGSGLDLLEGCGCLPVMFVLGGFVLYGPVHYASRYVFGRLGLTMLYKSPWVLAVPVAALAVLIPSLVLGLLRRE